MERECSRPLRAGHPLKKALAARGLVARVVFERVDGEPLTADDRREVDATAKAYEAMDRAAYNALRDRNERPAKPVPRVEARSPKRKAAKRPRRSASR